MRAPRLRLVHDSSREPTREEIADLMEAIADLEARASRGSEVRRALNLSWNAAMEALRVKLKDGAR